MMMKKTFSISDLGRLLLSIIVCQLAGVIGAIFTTSQIQSWYQYLEKPLLTPPSWVFGPVWTLLYTLMGISLFLVCRSGKTQKKVRVALRWFLVQLLLNTLWSIIFFGLHAPLLSLFTIIVMWSLIVITIKHFIAISRWAGWLLIPYLLWVSYASYLNAMIWLLNR